jgi:hypothetical protein
MLLFPRLLRAIVHTYLFFNLEMLDFAPLPSIPIRWRI